MFSCKYLQIMQLKLSYFMKWIGIDDLKKTKKASPLHYTRYEKIHGFEHQSLFVLIWIIVFSIQSG